MCYNEIDLCDHDLDSNLGSKILGATIQPICVFICPVARKYIDSEVLRGDEIEVSNTIMEGFVLKADPHDSDPNRKHDPLPKLEPEARALVTKILK